MEPRPSAPESRPQGRVEQDLRAERAAALARRGGGTARRNTGIDYLVCACAEERFGLPLSAVAQVLPMRPCTPVPGAVPSLIGLVALSGRIVGVLSLARALGRPEAASEAASGHLVVLRGVPANAQPVPPVQVHARPIAFAVDGVLGIVRAAIPIAGSVSGPTAGPVSGPKAGPFSGPTANPIAGPAAEPGSADRDGLGNAAASGYAPGAAGDDRPDFVVIDLPRLLRRALP